MPVGDVVPRAPRAAHQPGTGTAADEDPQVKPARLLVKQHRQRQPPPAGQQQKPGANRAVGAAEPQADVELLAMADQLLKELGIEGVTLHLNTLGDGDSREAWRAALVEHFRSVKDELSEESQERLEKNPLRILDSKDRRDQRFVADAPKIDDFLTDEARGFFDAVTSGLDAAGVKWVRAESLVRGLDYYRHTAFEFIPDEGSAAADALGSQSTILGGGRYDGLIESLGGPATPAVGWAAGIERLAMLVDQEKTQWNDDWTVAVIPVGDAAEQEAQNTAETHMWFYVWNEANQSWDLTDSKA